MSADEWTALPWHLRRVYLDGMEQDESVPLTFEPAAPEGQQGAGVMSGLPEGFTPQVRQADPAAVIDTTRLLGVLDASRRSGGR